MVPWGQSQGKLIEKSCSARLARLDLNGLREGDSFQCNENTPFSKNVAFVDKVFVAAEVWHDLFYVMFTLGLGFIYMTITVTNKALECLFCVFIGG